MKVAVDTEKISRGIKLVPHEGYLDLISDYTETSATYSSFTHRRKWFNHSSCWEEMSADGRHAMAEFILSILLEFQKHNRLGILDDSEFRNKLNKAITYLKLWFQLETRICEGGEGITIRILGREFKVEDIMDILYKKAFNIVGEIGPCIWW